MASTSSGPTTAPPGPLYFVNWPPSSISDSGYAAAGTVTFAHSGLQLSGASRNAETRLSFGSG